MMLHRSTMKMLSDLISPKALERLLSDAARERHTTLSALDIPTLQDILKRDIYKRLQLSVPVLSGKGGTLEVHGGIDFLWLGDNLKALNGNDGFKPISLIGFTFTY